MLRGEGALCPPPRDAETACARRRADAAPGRAPPARGRHRCSNPDLQAAVLDRHDLVRRLVVHLAEEAHAPNVKRLLFALGALLRGSPTAAAHFVESAGLTLLEHVFDTSAALPEVRRRCLTLVTDLVREAPTLHAPIHEAIDRGRWCVPAATLLADPHAASVEKALQALDVLQPHCDVPAYAVAAADTYLRDLHAAALADGDSADHIHDLRAAVARLAARSPASSS